MAVCGGMGNKLGVPISGNVAGKKMQLFLFCHEQH
jgi:hypothetical protein